MATSLPLSTHSYLWYCSTGNILSHIYTRLISCETLRLGRHLYVLSFPFFIPVCECHTLWVVRESRMVCMTLCCIYCQCCSCYLCLLEPSLNILSGRRGEGQYCCSFLIFVFHVIILWLLACSRVEAYLYWYLAIRLVAGGQVFSLSHGTQVGCL